MQPSKIDHIVITAPSLAEGVNHVHSALGVAPGPGGHHTRMGTHNRLLKLGEKLYLEVIAIDPDAPQPDRPRWFELDTPGPVRLSTWVACCEDIQTAVAASPVSLGNIETMRRDRFQWEITIAPDGRLPLGGVAPSLIQWRHGHPADTLPDSGCSLIALEAFHPEPEKVRAVLQSIGFDGAVSVSPLAPGKPPYLLARIDTPDGSRTL